MVPDFNSVQLKIKRANKHIADVEDLIRRVPDAFKSTIEVDAKTGNKFIKYAIPNMVAIQLDMAVVIGDAIHNLKTALDFGWCRTAHRFNVPIDRFSKFPVRDTAKELANALQGRNVHTICPELYKRIVTDIQPYEGGNEDIWAVHHLDIIDKHQLLIPLFDMTAITDMTVEDEQGRISRGLGVTFAKMSGGGWYIRVPAHHQVKDKGHITVTILFNDGLPCEHQEIISVLPRFSRTVLKVVELLENL
jgi:hypothetical protein